MEGPRVQHIPERPGLQHCLLQGLLLCQKGWSRCWQPLLAAVDRGHGLFQRRVRDNSGRGLLDCKLDLLPVPQALPGPEDLLEDEEHQLVEEDERRPEQGKADRELKARETHLGMVMEKGQQTSIYSKYKVLMSLLVMGNFSSRRVTSLVCVLCVSSSFLLVEVKRFGISFLQEAI